MASRYGLEIRGASGGDAPGLAELLGLCGVSATPAAVAERLGNLSRDEGIVLLAHEWGPPSGVIVLTWHALLLADARRATVTTLLVAPEARRRGVGRLLLKAGAQAARQGGCNELILPVGPDQDGLRGFCEATGFAPTGASYVRSLRKRT